MATDFEKPGGSSTFSFSLAASAEKQKLNLHTGISKSTFNTVMKGPKKYLLIMVKTTPPNEKNNYTIKASCSTKYLVLIFF
jgi:hypothetical protein